MSVKIIASDGNASVSDTFVITISNVNDSPTDIALSSTTIDETAAATIGKKVISHVIGTLSTTDVDSSDTHTYSLVDKAGFDNNSFVIDQKDKTLGLKSQPDFEAKPSYKVFIKSQDATGASVTKEITISVIDKNEAPIITSMPSTAAMEDSKFTYTFKATDPDINDSVTYSAPNLASWLSFDASTGILTGTPDQAQVGQMCFSKSNR